MFYQNNISLSISDKKIDYWQKQLENIAPLLDFPTDKVRISNVNSANQINNRYLNFGQNLFILSKPQTQALKQIAQAEGVSVAIILLGAWKVLLHRYTNQQDLIVGCLDWSVNCHPIPLEILPIRITITEKQKFSQLWETINSQITAASNYVDLNIASLTEALVMGNSEFPISALSQILFRFKGFSTTSAAKLTNNIPTKELLLDIVEESEHLICRIEYNSNLFEVKTIERIVDNYQVLLQSIVLNPQNQITSLALLSASEKQQVVVEWNQTRTVSVEPPIPQLFEAQVKNNPDAVAIISQGQQLTYGELNAQANQLAHYLKSVGVCRESLVGLCIERSLSMVVGVLAILKAGGAYVPLDITNPTARIAFILEDAQVKVLLTQASLLDKLPTQIEQTICLDRDWDQIAQQSSNNLKDIPNSKDLAHIVYTSGSTGKPKGVMLTHGNLSHYANSLQLAFNITPKDIYLHRGSIALIVSARQLLMPLTQGASVLIVTAGETRNPLQLLELIKDYGVTIFDHVPSFWRSFSVILEQQPPTVRQKLLDNQVRLVAAGGEQVTPEIYQCWRATFKPSVKLANIYGQTEGTGVVTVYQIPNHIDGHFKSLPVGRPIPNMRVYLLDQNLHPVPVGVTAEIHISGQGVAKGYLNRPELTAERFVANPFIPGDRLYKTGDLGRYLADGSIQFLGRIDRQVNIQGLRIELGEIEAVLSQHPLVQETAIVVRENKLGETLAAYVVASRSNQPTVEELRSYLQQQLPSYMIPSSFIFIKTFPLTTSGKIDYRALSATNLEQATPEMVKSVEDPLEVELLELLQEILGIKSITPQDNFLELGGNSLLAARLVTEIQHKYQQSISVANVFQAGTLQNLATLIRQEQNSSQPQSFVPIKPGNSDLILFGIHNLGYGLEFYRPLAKYLSEDISLHGLSSFLSNEPNKPHPRDIIGLATYYTEELLKIQPQGPYYLMGVSFGGVIAYEIAQRLVSLGHEVSFLGMVDTFCPDQNAVRRDLPLQQRFFGHLDRIRHKGIKHIVDRVKWRLDLALHLTRSSLYQINWIRDNFADETSRNFNRAEYIQLTREHQQVNRNYVIKPYPGSINMFRAADDPDSKLDWQKLALSNLFIDDIPGEHLEILQEPNVEILAEKLQLALLRKQANL
ncbi:McnE protein [Chondrocystis sp. NIES-4102]|nr:McnE protein [Chondrocystis sp. NIES-4102]